MGTRLRINCFLIFFIKRYSTETEVFVEEVIFYGLSDRILAPLGDETQNKRVLFCMGGKRTLCVRSREAIWNIFEKPETSLLGNGKSFKKYLIKIQKMIHFVSKSHKCPVHIFHSSFNDQLLSRDDSTFSGEQLLHWKRQSLASIQGLSSCKVYFYKLPGHLFLVKLFHFGSSRRFALLFSQLSISSASGRRLIGKKATFNQVLINCNQKMSICSRVHESCRSCCDCSVLHNHNVRRNYGRADDLRRQ